MAMRGRPQSQYEAEGMLYAFLFAADEIKA
jgi:hypothetical protein